METILFISVPLSFLLMFLLLPISFVTWTGYWKQGVLLGWGCLTVWFMAAGVLSGMLDEQLAERLQLPEMVSVVPAVLIGWLPSMVISAAGYFLRMVLARYWPWFAKKIDENAKRANSNPD